MKPNIWILIKFLSTLRQVKFIFISIFIIFFPHYSNAKTRHNQNISKFSAVILNCHDGDTCRAQNKNTTIKIRLAGIDAPEIKQNEGQMAKKYLESRISTKEVQLECKGKSYDRIICLIYLKGENINEEMVQMGFAFDYAKYSHGKYKHLMEEAQNGKIGIWKTLQKSPFCTRHSKNENCTENSLYNQ